ncbi:YciI family protein [Pseudoxanthomonas sp. LH2527]|uniref:YciI family protein n=1 Tax=Pseudoxanthomonas sp. LH2527 TaxID=2923249 RepID=UPI001F138F75|nr:YciI family protein [Pseudoxanthomonas sp. LH2527]MCH6484328.1 YciI family protein [Pseudoxanthomonas sp. LH2527]
MAMRRPDFDEAVIAPHIAFLDELRAAGQLDMTGGFSDSSGGAYVLVNVASLDEAKAIAARDPLALTGTSELTVYEWNTR